MAIKARRALASQVRQRLRILINTGIYPPGSRLPNEEVLAETLGVSRTTLREALQGLTEEGLIVRRHGYGTFVNQRLQQVKSSLDHNFGISELIRATGHTPGMRDVVIQTLPAQPSVATRLSLAPQDEVFVIERVYLADQRPVVFSIEFLPATLLQMASYELTDLYSNSLYEFLARQLGLPIHHGIAQLRPLLAEAWLAQKLDLAPGTPVLYVEQVDYSLEQHPMLFSQEYHVADVFEFVIYRRGPGEG
ncbi:GntR family transcriptional regulator [Thermogemmatispora sp.]|uniref:GntR family transcriptional regulator n=1 Tax=Thermogemmatispora sp. TaxID=1968838 RepID=UPI001D6FA9FE|nr:GntR family transcriptional regulator [Thermogemmatispora sp.]MBX5451357.1 GntR family transcriptional regulator [Thermogemmatispora sp.]